MKTASCYKVVIFAALLLGVCFTTPDSGRAAPSDLVKSLLDELGKKAVEEVKKKSKSSNRHCQLWRNGKIALQAKCARKGKCSTDKAECRQVYIWANDEVTVVQSSDGKVIKINGKEARHVKMGNNTCVKSNDEEVFCFTKKKQLGSLRESEPSNEGDESASADTETLSESSDEGQPEPDSPDLNPSVKKLSSDKTPPTQDSSEEGKSPRKQKEEKGVFTKGLEPVGKVNKPGCDDIEIIGYSQKKLLDSFYYVGFRNNGPVDRLVTIYLRGGRSVTGRKTVGKMTVQVGARAIRQVELDYSANHPEIVKVLECR